MIEYGRVCAEKEEEFFIERPEPEIDHLNLSSEDYSLLIKVLKRVTDRGEMHSLIRGLEGVREMNREYEEMGELMTPEMEWRESGCYRDPTFPETPIRFSINCKDELLDWIPRQDGGIVGCQYMITDSKILEALSKVPCTLIINGQDWMHCDENSVPPKLRNTRKTIDAWYPRIKNSEGDCGIHVIEQTMGNYGEEIMHQKWLLGMRNLSMDEYPVGYINRYDEYNLVCGSFNLTLKGSHHYESLFFMDHVNGLTNDCTGYQKEDSMALVSKLKWDAQYLQGKSRQWVDLIS